MDSPVAALDDPRTPVSAIAEPPADAPKDAASAPAAAPDDEELNEEPEGPDDEGEDHGIRIQLRYVITGGGSSKAFPWIPSYVKQKGDTVYVGLTTRDSGCPCFMTGDMELAYRCNKYFTSLRRVRKDAISNALNEDANALFADMKMKHRKKLSDFKEDFIELNLEPVGDHPGCSFKAGNAMHMAKACSRASIHAWIHFGVRGVQGESGERMRKL